MNDIGLLQNAVEQAFRRPILKNFNNIDFQYYADAAANCVFIAGSKYLAPFILPRKQIDKFIKNATRDLHRSTTILSEYQNFRHDYKENIIIPDDIPEIAQLKTALGLTGINRQIVRKKRICAELTPPDFSKDLIKFEPDYHHLLAKVYQFQKNNRDTLEYTVLQDFIKAHRYFMRHLHSFSLWSPLNRHRLQQYTIEVLQRLIMKQDLPSEYYLSKRFFGRRRNAQKFTNALLTLQLKIAALADNPELLRLAHIFIRDGKQYTRELAAYKKAHTIAFLPEIQTLNSAAQHLFNNFAALCYLDGVKTSLEETYLDNCALKQGEALPTVSPEHEIRKVRQLLSECDDIDYRLSDTGRAFAKAQKSYVLAAAELDEFIAAHQHLAPQNQNAPFLL